MTKDWRDEYETTTGVHAALGMNHFDAIDFIQIIMMNPAQHWFAKYVRVNTQDPLYEKTGERHHIPLVGWAVIKHLNNITELELNAQSVHGLVVDDSGTSTCIAPWLDNSTLRFDGYVFDIHDGTQLFTK